MFFKLLDLTTKEFGRVSDSTNDLVRVSPPFLGSHRPEISKLTPIPPSLQTAAASSGPAATFMPASIIGWVMPSNFVTGVLITSGIYLNVNKHANKPWEMFDLRTIG